MLFFIKASRLFDNFLGILDLDFNQRKSKPLSQQNFIVIKEKIPNES